MEGDLRDPAATEPDDAATPVPASSRRWRIVGVTAMLAILLFWLWIFSGAAKKENPDRLADREWVERAEATCARTMARVAERARNAGQEDQATRADAIDESTEDLRAMLTDLRIPAPDAAADREVVDPWLADWKALLDDRDTYADAVRRSPDARFFTTEKFGDSLDEVIGIFADVNDMPSCAPAGDVG